MRFVFFFVLACRLVATPLDDFVPTTPDETALLSAQAVEEFVHPLSGQLAFHEVDLEIKGAQTLTLFRTYKPPRVCGRYDKNDRHDKFYLIQDFIRSEYGWMVWPHLWCGYNRTSPHFQVKDPSGFVLEFDIVDNRGILVTPSYGMSNLQGDEPSSQADLRNTKLYVEENKIHLMTPSGIHRIYGILYAGAYLLEKEILPNGKVIEYQYFPGTARMVCGNTWIEKKNDAYCGSDGTNAAWEWMQQRIASHKKYESREISPFHLKRSRNPLYVNEIEYNDRGLLVSYDFQNFPISCSYTQEIGQPAKVASLSTPSGSYHFSYDPPIAGQKGGSTVISLPSGAKKIYRYNDKLLLTAVQHGHQGEIVNQKVFEYDEKQHVKAIKLLDGKGHLLFAKYYECDTAGNPVLERHEGDFGSFCIRRRFDLNRCVWEEREDGLQYAWTYWGNTRLVSSKTTLDHGKELKKEVCVYDERGNLIEEQEVGKTRITYRLYANGPHMDRPEWEEKRDWDGNLLYKIHYVYDVRGNLIEEEHFDADGKSVYTLHRSYNSKNQLLSKTNPLGEEAIYRYDDRGRCVYEEPIANSLKIHREFDAKGRLTALKENERITRYSYNVADQLIAKTDYLGYKTEFDPDPVHGKPKRILEPGKASEIVFDALGREIAHIDPYKAITRYRYNSYGKPLEITFAEGGQETFAYFPNGLLKSHVDADGIATSYEYEALGRIVQKTIAGHTTTFIYEGDQLKTMTDPEGFVTEYAYDLSGRKISETRAGITTRYSYDPLGFLAGEDKMGRKICYRRDFLGRVLEQSVDGTLVTAWKYDRAGNVCAIERDGLTRFEYDAYNRLVQTIDPQGHRTALAYQEKPLKLVKTTLDPRGIQIVETYNPQNLLLSREVEGQLVEEYEYDLNQRMTKQNQLSFGYTPNGNRAWMQEAGTRKTEWSYTLGNRLQAKYLPDGAVLLYGHNEQGLINKVGRQTLRYDQLGRVIGGTGFTRVLDPFDNILQEKWSTGLWIESEYDAWNRPTRRILCDRSEILYTYEGPFLKSVSRVRDSQTIYAKTYEKYDEQGHPQKTQSAFETTYVYDKLGRMILQKSPYLQESMEYDAVGNLIRRGDVFYKYDSQSQMTQEGGQFSASYDAQYNRIAQNGTFTSFNALNQIVQAVYDAKGNLLQTGFCYDEQNRLIKANEREYVYDALGRRIQAGSVAYLYAGSDEIGAFEQGRSRELKIPGEKDIAAIEIQGRPFVPVQDAQGTIRKLIDWQTGGIYHTNNCDAFGMGLTDAIPYAYAGKRYDAETGLVYFGQRYYDPLSARWISPDPLGSVDHSNLYQYVFNNPVRFQDPQGASIGGYLFGIGEIILGGTIIATGFALEVATVGGFTMGLGVTTGTGAALIGHGFSMTTYHAQDLKMPDVCWKNTNVYAPGRPLPLDQHGTPVPETDAPHTQLGTKGSKRRPGESYPQAREFDGKGKPIKSIDFTDHGEPHIHPNPHEHPCKPNPTGGTPKRGDPQPLEHWKY